MKLLFIILLIFPCLAFSFDHSYKSYNQILKDHVTFKGKQSLVNYQKLKSSPQSFNTFLKELSNVKKDEYKNWNEKQKIAFLINSYNTFTLKLIIDHYPVASIKDIGSFFKSAWKKKFFVFLETESHLDNIEHDILRKDFNEPRIHFAVVCASLGCPTLQDQAFTAQNLDTLLNQSAKNFLTDNSKNRVEAENKKLYLSKIFDWYGDDFKQNYGGYLKYIAPLMSNDPQVQKNISQEIYDLNFLSYDWKLNKI